MVLALSWGCTPDDPPAVPDSPQRIVSFIPSATELLFAIGAGPRVVGVTVHDDYPPQVEALPRVYDTSPNYGQVAALKPDLVVRDSSINKPGELRKLQALGIAAHTMSCQRLADIPQTLRELGVAIGSASAGDEAAQTFEEKLARVVPLEKQPRVFVEIWGSPLMTAGTETMPDDVINAVGAENIFADQKGYFQVVNSTLVARKPDIILLPLEPNRQTSAAAEMLAKLGVRVRVIKIDSSLLTKPTPRVLEGIKALHSAL